MKYKNYKGYSWVELTRKEAQEIINKKIDKLNIPKELLGHFVFTRSDFSRHRNYEIESDFEQAFNRFYIIMELCPFDAEFCTYGEYLKLGRKKFNEYMIEHIEELNAYKNAGI